MRSAHCSDAKCRTEADMRLYTRHIKREEVLYCKACTTGIVKPDIVFFGEKLPKQFGQKYKAIAKADLVFVMGTSLKVQPFSTLLTALPASTPLVVLNHTNPTSSAEVRENFLFLEGDIDTSVLALMGDIGWAAPPGKTQGKPKKRKA
jgi:NAD-dependent SIR2 family protein deacetylase